MSRGYQTGFSSMHGSMYSIEERRQKASTMVAILNDAFGDRLKHADVLDLGCSTGIIDEFLAPHVGSMTGVDIDEPALNSAKSNKSAPNIRFEYGDAMNLRFEAGSFDILICSQVYEHVPDANRMMQEIYRVLRPCGACYFAATNRWALMEKHHHLPFLSWLPIPLANIYMRLAGKGDSYYERHLGYNDLTKLTSAFRIEDYTQKILADPSRFEAGYLFKNRTKLSIARAMFRWFRAAFPGYIWLLRKDPA